MNTSKSTNMTPPKQSSANFKKSPPEQNTKTPIKSQSVKPKRQNNEDRLNQSMSKLNSSMTSSVKS